MDNNNLNTSLDLSVLDNLTPAQKELALSILKEYSETGTSSQLNDMLLEDYAETPVDILTFVDDYNYLGNAWHDAEGKSKLYPYWRKELIKLFPDNLTTTVNNAIFSGSRGRGKTEIAVLIAAYLLHRVLCLKDPVGYYHLKPTEKLVFAFMNIKLALAEEIGIAKFQNTIQSSPWFMSHGLLEGRTKKLWVPKKFGDQVAIDIKIGSQADDLIGLPIFFCLEGNTPILTDKGTFKIEDLVDKQIKVPTVDDNNQVVLSDECTVKKTAESDIEYEIELEDGSIIKCTPSHRFRLKDGTYKEAQHLTEDDELLDFNPYDYVYKTTNLTNDKIYIGQHEGAYLDKNYIGSDFNNFKCELLQLHPDKKSLDEGEKYYILKNNSLNPSLGYKATKMKIKSIKINHFNEAKQYYDVINANPYNNFLIKTNTGYICSHNCFFDEVSFQRNQDVEKQKQKANDAIDTAIGGMKTRFVHNGKNPTLLALASSKRSDKSFLEEHMKKKLKSEKDNVYISDGSVWEVKPEGTYSKERFRVGLGNKFLQSLVIPDEDDSEKYLAKGYKILEVPVDFRADFLDDIDRALCDFAGISSSSITKYINGQAVYDIVTDDIQNPFTREILEIGNDPNDEAQYYNFFDLSKISPALRSKPLFIHLDMSISGDMTGIAGVFIKGKKLSSDPDLQNKDLFYSLAFSVNIKAPKGRQISFEKNRNFIYWLKEKGFNIKGITTDSFQSCLPEDEEIQTPLGPIKIKDAKPGQVVLTYNIEKDIIEPETITFAGETRQTEDLYEIELSNGQVFQCTGNHLILTPKGYIRADELSDLSEIVCSIS